MNKYFIWILIVLLWVGQVWGAGLTILTHGWDNDLTDDVFLSSPDTPVWLIKMRDNIIQRYKEGFGSSNISTSEIVITGGHSISGYISVIPEWKNAINNLQSDPSGEVIIIVNWTDVSGTTESISTTSIAPYLYDILKDTQYILSLPIHLIGHSRGGSLMSALVDEFAQRGIWVDHLTTLDPHPVNQFDRPDAVLSLDYSVHVGTNVLFADNYYQEHGYPSGMSIEGSYNRFFQRSNLSGARSDAWSPALNKDHSDVHLWYAGTINCCDTDVYDGENNIIFQPIVLTKAMRSNWYSSTNPNEENGLKTGFHYSRIGGGDRKDERGIQGYHNSELLGGNGSRSNYVTDTSGVVWPNIIEINVSKNGNMVKKVDSIQVGEPLTITYWGQDYKCQSTVELKLDSDRNPFTNNDICSIAWFKPEASHKDIFSNSYTYSTSNLAQTSGYIYAKISDGERTRYLYYEEQLSFVPKPTIIIRTLQSKYGGFLSPQGDNQVSQGGTLSFTASPDNGYVVDKWYLDGQVITGYEGKRSFILSNIQQIHTVLVTFVPLTSDKLVIIRPALNPYTTGSSHMTFSGSAPPGTYIVKWRNLTTNDEYRDTGDLNSTTWIEDIDFDLGTNIIEFKAFDSSNNQLASASTVVNRIPNGRKTEASNFRSCWLASGSLPDPRYNGPVEVGYSTSPQIFKTQKGYIRFDLPSLPPGCQITSARFNAITYEGGMNAEPMGVRICRINEEWDITRVTWSSKPQLITNDSAITNVGLDKGISYEWDLTEMVKSWYASGHNYGVVMNSTQENNPINWHRVFDDHRFNLIVEYEIETTCPLIKITQPTTAESYITNNQTVTISGTASDNYSIDHVDYVNNTTGQRATAVGKYAWSCSVPLVAGNNSIAIVAYDSSGNTNNQPINVTYLVSPANLTASDDLNDFVLVEWSPVVGATYYQICRSTSQTGDKIPISSWIQNSLSYIDNTAQPGVIYYFWVRAAMDASGTNASSFSSPDQGLKRAVNPNPASGGLAAQWKFNEKEGTLASDASGNGRVATLINGPEWVGQAICTDGVDDYVDAGVTTFDLTGEMTILVRFKPSGSMQNQQTLVQRGITSNPFSLGLEGKTIQLCIRTSNGADWLNIPTQIQTDQWYHIAMTYKSGERIIYLNGMQVSKDSTPSTGNLIVTPGLTTTIASNGNGGGFFKGFIDDIRIYNRTLSASEVVNAYYTVEGRENWLSMIHLPPTDPNGNPITYSPTVNGLPKRAIFDPVTNMLFWQPWYDQAGSYELLFQGLDSDYTQKITITVEDILINQWYQNWINSADIQSEMTKY